MQRTPADEHPCFKRLAKTVGRLHGERRIMFMPNMDTLRMHVHSEPLHVSLTRETLNSVLQKSRVADTDKRAIVASFFRTDPAKAANTEAKLTAKLTGHGSVEMKQSQNRRMRQFALKKKVMQMHPDDIERAFAEYHTTQATRALEQAVRIVVERKMQRLAKRAILVANNRLGEDRDEWGGGVDVGEFSRRVTVGVHDINLALMLEQKNI